MPRGRPRIHSPKVPSGLVELRVDYDAMNRILQAMDKLPIEVFDKCVGQAINYASTPTMKQAGAAMPTRYGILQAAIGKKKVSYTRDGNAAVIIGARKGFATVIAGKKVNPSNYLHLVEKGHVTRGRRGRVAGRHVLERALAQNASVSVSRYTQKMSRLVDKESQKLFRG